MEGRHTTPLLVAVVLLAVTVTTGEAALKCYSCTSLTNSNCRDPFVKTPGTEPTECIAARVQEAGQSLMNTLSSLGSKFGLDMPQGAKVPDDAKWGCMKIDYLDDKGKNFTMRGCRLPDSDIPNLDLCKKPPPGMKVTYCDSCEGDGCNGAGRLGGVSILFYLLLPCLVAVKAVAA